MYRCVPVPTCVYVLVSACILVQGRRLSINHGAHRSLPNPDPDAAWRRPPPHLSPSGGDGRGCDSPKRSRSLAGRRTWCWGGRASHADTWSCRWLRADRPCSPTPGLPLCRSGTCTRRSVPRPLGSVAWRAPRWRTRPAPWAAPARASQLSSCVFLVSSCLISSELITAKWTSATLPLLSVPQMDCSSECCCGRITQSGGMPLLRNGLLRATISAHLRHSIAATSGLTMRCVNKWVPPESADEEVNQRSGVTCGGERHSS